MNALPLLVCTLLLGAEPTTINLWGEKIPGPVSSAPKNVPTLTIQLAEKDKASGTAVVICPGAGYSGRATNHEGKQIAEWLNERGVHAFILKSSNEKQVTSRTPPTFLFHTVQDKAVPIENSRMFKAACEKAGVPVELVEYEEGQHGVGLGLNTNLPLAGWSVKLDEWMRKRGLLEK